MSFDRRVTPPGGTRTTDTRLEDLDEIAERYAHAREDADGVRARLLRDQMISAAIPMADRLARRYRGGAEPLADLEQVARMGLVKVVDRYAPERGSFTAYAMYTIVGELKRHLRDRSWAVHVSRSMQELAMATTRHEAELTRELGRRPTDTETAQRAGITVGELDRARTASAGYRSVSLDMPISDGGGRFGDLFGDVDAEVEKVADRLTVTELIARLPARERQVVVAVYYGGRTQADIAAQIGVSQMQISRILSRVLTWLRAGLLTDRVPRWPGSGDEDESFQVTAVSGPAGQVEIRVRGEVDRDNADRLRTALLDLVCRQPAGRRVTLQLAGVPLLDAAGIRVLLTVYEAAQARGVTVTATGLTPVVRQIATVAGLTPMLAPPEHTDPPTG
ncbi:sigma-70 family RNA polymerase sigma factor [Actinoplanes sp. DH11]|uniref:sigma-70 family RNA polymerase sigma factor n=1 Tax=Actinoplanes sp. DH11 TaxID=2857011 RepID=UPI001E47639B|nr:sigma-70 family RNA polymerase sigma factor [Actinoplanes sp. DH11]